MLIVFRLRIRLRLSLEYIMRSLFGNPSDSPDVFSTRHRRPAESRRLAALRRACSLARHLICGAILLGGLRLPKAIGQTASEKRSSQATSGKASTQAVAGTLSGHSTSKKKSGQTTTKKKASPETASQKSSGEPRSKKSSSHTPAEKSLRSYVF